MDASHHIDQINACISSPLIEQYLVGITCDVMSRRKSYQSIGFPFFFILELGLKKDEAISLERELFNLLVNDKNAATYKKYHREKRDGKYHASTGGKVGETYSVYIAAYGS